MNNLLTLSYWFDLRPAPLLPLAQNIFLALLLALAILSVVTFVLKARGGLFRGFCKRLYAFGLSNLVIGLILLFFDYETVPFLSARFWLGIWFVVMLAWLAAVILGLRAIPKHQKEREQEEERKKYLP